jgi:hypothetical protein
MGEVVPRCGAGSLVKIVVRESLKSQVCASWHVQSMSHRCVQALVSVRIRCS